MKQATVAFIVGIIFALGLGLSGMTQPQKVIGFLDLSDWDPALLFVMVGAVGFHAIAFPIIRRRTSPLLEKKWHLPKHQDVTWRLILGSALFGVGWGLGGFCPGPALVSIFSADQKVFLFVTMMLVGMVVCILFDKNIASQNKKTL